MFVEIIPEGGIGRAAAPIRLRASQIVIRDDLGNPLCVAALFGPDGAIAVAKADDEGENFHRVLKNLGIQDTVLVDTLRLPTPPPGAVLLSDPRSTR